MRERRDSAVSEHDALGKLRGDLRTERMKKGSHDAYRLVAPSGFGFELYELEYQVALALDGERSAAAVARMLGTTGFPVSARQVLAFYRELRGMSFIEERAAADSIEPTATSTAVDVDVGDDGDEPRYPSATDVAASDAITLDTRPGPTEVDDTAVETTESTPIASGARGFYTEVDRSPMTRPSVGPRPPPDELEEPPTILKPRREVMPARGRTPGHELDLPEPPTVRAKFGPGVAAIGAAAPARSLPPARASSPVPLAAPLVAPPAAPVAPRPRTPSSMMAAPGRSAPPSTAPPPTATAARAPEPPARTRGAPPTNRHPAAPALAPAAAPAAQRSLTRTLAVAIALAAVLVAVALVLLSFASRRGAASRGAAPGTTPAPGAGVGEPDAAAASPAPVTLGRASRVAHPQGTIEAPHAGELVSSELRGPRAVAADEKLFVIRQAFDGAGKPDRLLVRAPFAATATPRVKQGSRIERGQVLADLLDETTWEAELDVAGAAPASSWRCRVRLPGARSDAACTVASIHEPAVAGAGRRVVIRFAVADTPWLDGKQLPEIALSPP